MATSPVSAPYRVIVRESTSWASASVRERDDATAEPCTGEPGAGGAALHEDAPTSRSSSGVDTS